MVRCVEVEEYKVEVEDGVGPVSTQLSFIWMAVGPLSATITSHDQIPVIISAY